MDLGAIADDVTGGTDLASVLRRGGARVLQTLSLPRAPLPAADALVISEKTRTAPVAAATRAAREAARVLAASGARQVYFKYCSTFDSTDAGNIGPVIETLLAELDAPFTVACPAYPALGRTVYQGHLFVGDRLLSESSMRHHPLTPMTDADLVRVLARQCALRVGLVPLADVDAGVEAVRTRIAALTADGVRVAIVDAVSDRHVDIAGAACADLRLATGGAALGGALLRAREGHSQAHSHDHSDRDEARMAAAAGGAATRGVALLSGSCSAATLVQVQRAAQEVPSRRLDPCRLADDPDALPALMSWACELAARGPVLLYSTARPDAVQDAQDHLGRADAATLLDGAFDRIARALAAAGVRSFIIAGGETSGAVLQALDIRMLTFGDEIDPGVPWTHSLDPAGFTFALKSGNFGGPDFFLRALRAAADGVHTR